MPAFFSDDFADAPLLDLSGGGELGFFGDNVGSTGEGANDPLATGYGSHTVWTKITATFDTGVNLSTDGSEFDTVLGVYTGTWGSLTQVAFNDDSGGGGFGSALFFPAAAGQTYYVEIGNYSDLDGYAPYEGAVALLVTLGDEAPAVSSPGVGWAVG